MKVGLSATLGVASIFALACADSPQSPTDPGLSARTAILVPAACDAATSRAAKAQLMDMLSGANLKAGQAKWAAVESACSTSTDNLSNGPLMEYVAFVRGLYPAGFIAAKKGATQEGNLLAHLNVVFPYVGYDAPGLPAGVTSTGILAVITQSSSIREYQREHLGAFKLAVQDSAGDKRAHLFAMYATDSECLTANNLKEFGNCVQLNSYPETSGFSPAIKVGICSPDNLTGKSLALGHQTTSGTEIAGKEVNYPADCHTDLNVASTSTGFERALTRLASFGRRTFGVQRAYAADKGLGGIGSTLSPWGIVESQVFATSFSSPQVVGTAPVAEGDYTFTQTVTAPGSILIQSSLGNSSDGQLVVLSQGGGACANCGNLLLRANFYSESGSPADEGKYQINWKSVQAAPSVKSAPFVLRDSVGNRIATLEYKTVSSQNVLLYNGAQIGTWVRNAVQSFEILVDIDGKTTSLRIDGSPVALNAAAAAFQTGTATNIASLAAEFTGIDSGVMGWDEIGVQRVSDQPSPSN